MANKNAAAAASAAPRANPEKGSLREDLRRFTSERILAAAMECFAEQGFRATTVERIVEVAGTTAPTFYRHFPSKNDLLAPLRAHLTTIVRDTVAELEGEASRTREGVRAWVGKYLQMWGEVHRLCEAFWEATASNAEFAAEAMPETIRTVGVLTSFFQDMPAPERDRIAVRLSLMVLFLDRLAFLASVERSPERRDQLVDEFAEMLWLAVFANPPAKRRSPARRSSRGRV